MATILMPLPAKGFDPTETGIPWRVLTGLGHRFVIAAPDGAPGAADPRMLTGAGLGPLAPVLRADRNGADAYRALAASPEFRQPLAYESIAAAEFDALLLPCGHAKPMRAYLESALLQAVVATCFAAGKPVGAICHGVVLAARSRDPSGRSVLHGRRTTALLKHQELLAWTLTRLWLGDYYRTYPQTVEDEVTAALARKADFEHGPLSLRRDTPEQPDGFAVIDGAYVSARWPGDAHGFARAFDGVLRSTIRAAGGNDQTARTA
jgi:protease I